MAGITGRLAGRIALITGASRGIGPAIARCYAREGAHVVLVARTVGGLEEVDDSIKALGGSATLVPLDLTDFEKIDQMGLALYQRFGRLDILVGNAGILGVLGPLGHTEPKLWQRVIDLNLTANWRLIRSMDPLLRAAPAGHALFTTASVGHEAIAYWGAYAISKAGLEMMAKIYAAEQGNTRIRVNLIDPGPVATNLRKTAFPGEDRAGLPTPDDIAARFLDPVLPA